MNKETVLKGKDEEICQLQYRISEMSGKYLREMEEIKRIWRGKVQEISDNNKEIGKGYKQRV